MLKSKIRKKILNLRKSKNTKLDFVKVYNFLKKFNLKNKSVGGYYPVNYELDDLNILKGLELKNIKTSLPVIKKKKSNGFLSLVS